MASSTRPPMQSEPPDVLRQKRHRALGVLAIVAALVLVRIAAPFGVGLFIGALLGFSLQPAYGALRRRHLSAGFSSLLCAVGAALVVSATLVGVMILFVSRGLRVLSALPDELGPQGSLGRFVTELTRMLTVMHTPVTDVSATLQAEAVSMGGRVAGWAADVATWTFGTLLALFFMTLSTYFVLRHWGDLARHMEELLPFERRHTHELLNQFRRAGRQVLLGTVLTGIIQGMFAAVGYRIVGVPEPGFWGVVTALASLVPAVGTLLVWVPIGIFKIATGHPVLGATLLIYSALTVGLISDYVIRPRLVGREPGVPTVLTFIALFGGVEVFGVVGLVLGPVLVTLSVAVLRTYQESLRAG
ncbi:MAG: AI-2E family transporter [Myxococcales bacterium]|nr:AI-2E family transporter [Myxococcales bacterium]